MGKNKAKEYLPLTWCKKLESQLRTSVGDMTVEDMDAFLDPRDPERLRLVLQKYPRLTTLVSYMKSKQETDPTASDDFKEFFSDFDAIRNIKYWSLNKQVYKFDKDFTEELIRTENPYTTKDVFDFLPFKSFYVDISDNKELCKEIYCDGFFIYVDKVNLDEKETRAIKPNASIREYYMIHICKVNDELFFNDSILTENKEQELQIGYDNGSVKIQRLVNGQIVNDQVQVNRRKLIVIVYQMLLYLSSVEPDIIENENTKKTYRKPNGNTAPKHKFSEIQAYDVGVRFGNAFRNWKSAQAQELSEDQNENDINENEELKAPRKVRPHARRGHRHFFWYGKKDGSTERVKRQRWVEETFVGLRDGKQEAVIHKVKRRDLEKGE